MLDGGRLVVAHAGLIERYHGRASGRVREFCLYGQTTGETDEYGLPVRYPWAQEYRGRAVVLYGHTPVPAAEWLNNTLCLDTGCVFGGRLTALNYPERTGVRPGAPASTIPRRGLFPRFRLPAAGSSLPRREPDVLDIGDVSGSPVIETAYLPRVGVRDAHAAAALEVMSRFAIDPRWLLYLPPTMSPVATAARGDLLEHPDQAFDAYRADGVESVLCEEKHMGSRAVLLVCRSPDDARRPASAAAAARRPAPRLDQDRAARSSAARAGPDRRRLLGRGGADRQVARGRPGSSMSSARPGCSWTPNCSRGTSRPALLRDQYAAVGAAALASLPAAVSVLEQACARGLPGGGRLPERTRARLANAEAFTAAYLRYCWATDGLAGVRVAPFQLLASEGAVYHERPHLWHLGLADRLAAAPRS